MKRNFLKLIVVTLLVGCNSQQSTIIKTAHNTEKEIILELALQQAYESYGKSINDELPLVATLVGDSIWKVSGTFSKGKKGGTVQMTIDRKSKDFINITHGK